MTTFHKLTQKEGGVKKAEAAASKRPSHLVPYQGTSRDSVSGFRGNGRQAQRGPINGR